jgi:hypothetical protein
MNRELVSLPIVTDTPIWEPPADSLTTIAQIPIKPIGERCDVLARSPKVTPAVAFAGTDEQSHVFRSRRLCSLHEGLGLLQGNRRFWIFDFGFWIENQQAILAEE